MTDFTDSLLAWYDHSARALPWRQPPGVLADPYAVWLSEIMLQQTTVKAVIPYFQSFIARWPTVADIAAASLDDVLAAWAGLGYYSRARNLHACARIVADDHGGKFPDDEAGLRRLPGVGPYTAAAIAAIAFNRRAAAVDGNVERVISRLSAIEDPLPGAKARIRETAAALTPAGRPGDFAQAMMDLGATICTPRSPSCSRCPVSGFCAGYSRGIAETLPVKPPKKERPNRYGVAFLAVRGDGAVLLRRRPPKGLLGGMLEVPSSDWVERRTDWRVATARAPLAAPWRALAGPVAHTFTHFHLELEVCRALGVRAAAPEGCRWHPRSSLGELALPSVMRKVLARGLNGH